MRFIMYNKQKQLRSEIMEVLNYIFAAFVILGAVDRIFGNRLGFGKEFEKGVEILGTMALAMVGMIVMAPVIANGLRFVTDFLPPAFDPSVLPSLILANDMGGGPLCVELSRDAHMGWFNGLVVASMMGCTVSFTIPFAMGAVDMKYHGETLLGILCGIVTIPVGCFVGGLVAGIGLVQLAFDLVPIVVLSAVIAAGLVKVPGVCLKIFSFLGKLIKAVITVGLANGIFETLTGIKIIPGADTLESGIDVITNLACVMAGVFSLIFLASKLLSKPLEAVGKRMGIGGDAAMGIVSSLATSVTAFSAFPKMNKKGRLVNSAFAVSGAFVFADHLAYTLVYGAEFVPAVVAGKLSAGLMAVVLSLCLYSRLEKVTEK